MKDFGVKFRLIILPFLLIVIATIAAYSFLHWYLLIDNQAVVINEEIVNFVVPFAVSLLPVLIWLRPRIKLLDFTGKKTKNPVFGHLLFTCIIITIPTIIAQEYLISATGKLTSLNSINQIESYPKTKYYAVKNVYVDKKQVRINTIINISGKHNTNYNMAIYMPCPIFDSRNVQQEPNNLHPLAWLGIKYQKTISNRLSGAEKTREYDTFIKESQGAFDKRDLTNFSYLDRIGPNRELKKYANGVTFSGTYDAPFIILVPRWGRYEDRNGNKALWLAGSFIIVALAFMLMIAVVPLKGGIANDSNDEFISAPFKI